MQTRPIAARKTLDGAPPGRLIGRVLAALSLLAVAAAAAETRDDGRQVKPALVRLGAERIELPGSEHLTLIGTSYLIEFAPGWWAGPAAYGAVSGERGGLFTVGAELGRSMRLSGPWVLDVGLFAGGGGGGSAPVGGGLMLRPHVDLLYESGRHRTGLSVSKVRFANGDIDSTQLGLVWNVATDFRFVSPDRVGDVRASTSRSGIGFDRVQAVGGYYFPSSSARRLDGQRLPSKIGFAGARFEQALNDHVYWGVEAAGAASGGVPGYAEYLGSIGAETEFDDARYHVGGRLAVGMAGGGEVDVGGGLLVKAGLYGIVRLAGDLGVTLEAGLAKAPQGSFEARYANVALNWVLDDRVSNLQPVRTTLTEWSGGVEQYRAARRDGRARDLQAVTLRVNRFMTERMYLTGQAHSAVGGEAGGYAVGLLGAGFQHRAGPWQFSAEATAGAAGGGGVETAGGLVMQPMAYLGYEFQPGVALRLGAGRLRALRGPLDAGVVDLSITFSFGVSSRAAR